jgi:hypothetical protein
MNARIPLPLDDRARKVPYCVLGRMWTSITDVQDRFGSFDDSDVPQTAFISW